jgi:hypothetical protein
MNTLPPTIFSKINKGRVYKKINRKYILPWEYVLLFFKRTFYSYDLTGSKITSMKTKRMFGITYIIGYKEVNK